MPEKATEMERDLKRYVPEKRARRIFAKVFDEQTVMALHKLASRGHFDVVEFVVSTGKEAHVFRAVDKKGNYLAVKIYKISTSNFKHMDEYIRGDERFRHIKREKRGIVFAWTKKEFKNLSRAYGADVRVPKPVAFLDNVLVMEFIGDEKGEACRAAKEVGLGDAGAAEKAYKKMVEYIARLMYKAGLVHADISEYNMLVRGNEIVLIDIGQAVLLTHPRAEEFFERDIKNVRNYFGKLGVERSREQVIEEMREWKGKLKGK